MKLKDIGEFGLIDKIRKKFKTKSKDILIGIGDDTSVIKTRDGNYELYTTDIIIEDVHFNLRYTKPYQIGRKALSVNISDIAAMGGIPKFALVSIGLSKDYSWKFTSEIFRGIKKCANKFGVHIVGGDTVSSKKIILNIALIGEVEKEYLTMRSGAKVGDKIFATGSLGNSSCGLELLKRKNNKDVPINTYQYLVNSHLLPNPALKLIREILKIAKLNSMIDISDGLIGDIVKLSKESKVGFKIYQDLVPVSKELKLTSKFLKKNALDFALHRGEDYEFLFTANKRFTNFLLDKFKERISCIGEILQKEEGYNLVDKDGKKLKIEDRSYNHFSSLP